jgi:hypothetical protein
MQTPLSLQWPIWLLLAITAAVFVVNLTGLA